jgi:hypothetical protein
VQPLPSHSTVSHRHRKRSSRFGPPSAVGPGEAPKSPKRSSMHSRKQVLFAARSQEGCLLGPCGNYHCLNTVTVRDSYPCPTCNHSMAASLVALFFSKIDVVKPYHQILIAKADVPKLVIATPFGLFLQQKVGKRFSPGLFEHLTAVSGIKHFCSHLEGRPGQTLPHVDQPQTAAVCPGCCCCRPAASIVTWRSYQNTPDT